MSRPAKRPFDRLIAQVEITDGCWLWRGYSDRFWLSPTETIWPHRAMWRAVDGEPGDGWRVWRLCGNCACVRPTHLYIRKKDHPSFLMLPAETAWAFEKKVRSNAGM